MYLEYFGIKEFPFRLTPDVDFLYLSSVHARAKAYMEYSVWNREGFVVITGDVGCGKTTLIQKLLSELVEEDILLAKIFQTQLNDVEFLQAVLVEFGLNPFSAKKVELMDMLNTFLIEKYQQGKHAILIVDEAQNLSLEALEELRMLSGLETQKEKVLHIILVGQPQLNETLESPEMEQLAQRVRLRFHLKPLTLAETGEYIQHRLRVAGASRANIFSPDTTRKIFEYTGGIPRLINTLSDTAMTCAYADSVASVTSDVIAAAVEELQWQPYAKRMASRRMKAQAAGEGQTAAHTSGRGRMQNQFAGNPDPDGRALMGQLGRIETLLQQILQSLQKTSKSSETLPRLQNKRNQG
jgi:type II secretory pathway predicted ATPase ExeA